MIFDLQGRSNGGGGPPDGSLPQLVTPEKEGGSGEGEDPAPGREEATPKPDTAAAEGSSGPRHQDIKGRQAASGNVAANGCKQSATAGSSGKTLDGVTIAFCVSACALKELFCVGLADHVDGCSPAQQ